MVIKSKQKTIEREREGLYIARSRAKGITNGDPGDRPVDWVRGVMPGGQDEIMCVISLQSLDTAARGERGRKERERFAVLQTISKLQVTKQQFCGGSIKTGILKSCK